MERKNAWTSYSAEERKQVFALGERYRRFISENKTERECTKAAIELAEAKGYEPVEKYIEAGTPLRAGSKVYASCMGKSLVLFNIGTEPIERGMNILGAHIDSPRLDLKPNPLYEDTEMALLDTHYYGGIKKYQWVTIPLALHGVVALKSGEIKNIVIGEDASDPVVGITDLLIHLSADQLDKKGSVVIEGEDLDLLIGSEPATVSEDDKDSKELVKKNILSVLKDKYGIEEEDFLSAELEAVPAGDLLFLHLPI